MNSARLVRIHEVFELVVALPRNERAGLLDSVCGNNDALRAKVEALLKHEREVPEAFLTLRQPGLASDKPVAELVGRILGQYRIESVIAVGGMGIVYAATQKSPERIVALKVMHRHLASPRTLRRFRFESETLARLRHPNIAQIFEAGISEDEGTSLPFFAMEYVLGADPITTFAREAKIDIKAKLTLFLEVCDGVQHGHQRGIIHRDLKPSNILVDDEGRVKIIDFGVARSTNADIAMTTMHTEVGQLIGTLQYMSPEQCAPDPMEIDTRCDVYALGAVLYELLTGRLPYNTCNMTLHAASRVICEQPAERPSRFASSLKGNLDAIILKALAKHREDRYDSVSEFASDLRAFLRGEPIHARPPTLWQRTTACAMRNPKATAVLTSLIIVAGIVGCVTVAVIKVKRNFDMQPGRMVFSEERRGEATLMARSGKTIARWGFPGSTSIRFAMLHGSTGGMRGTAYAIVGGYSVGSPTERHQLADPDGVNVYKVAEGKVEFLWTNHVRDEDLPASLRAENQIGFAASSFGAHSSWLFDVFPSRRGEELVVVFSHPFSRRMLVIYDLGTGEPLYRVWHDGFISSVSFLTKPGLLLLAVEDARIYLEDMGYAAEEIRPPGATFPARYPTMIVALKPEIGMLEPAFIAMNDRMNGPRPVWIRWLTPAWAQDVVRLRFLPVQTDSVAGTQVRCSVDYTDSRAAFWFRVDQNGQVIPFSRTLGDAYNLYRGEAPEHSVFQLCDRLPLPGEEVAPGQCPP